jgi:hypothetical protein
MNTVEPRICPEERCGRLLTHFEGKYLCYIHQVLLTKEDTSDHPIPGGLCVFKIQECEMGVYYSCFACGKTIFFSKEEEEKRLANYQGLFDPEKVKVKREEYLKWTENNIKMCRQKEEKDVLIKRMMSMTQKELAELVTQ